MSAATYEFERSGRPDRSITRGAVGGIGLAALLLALAVAAQADCVIQGPSGGDVDDRFTLCGPTGDGFRYRWTGAGIVSRNDARCVTVLGRSTGLYEYTLTVYGSNGRVWDQCQTSVSVGRVPTTPSGDCDIDGPQVISAGQTAVLCGPSSNLARTWSWTGPGGFSATSTCIRVSREGVYVLSYRDRLTNEFRRCTHTLRVGDYDDPEPPVDDDTAYDNCPRNAAFWAQACRAQRDVEPAEMRQIVRGVDAQSRALNWTNDLSGFCATLRPGTASGQRREAARQLATLLANMNAAEHGVWVANGRVGIDPETPVSFRGARTVRQLAGMTDAMLVRGRGNFAQLNRYLTGLNNGRGVGSVCD